MEITIYNLTTQPPQPKHIDTEQLVERIRHAAYRFWVSQRRNPSAIIISTQLAQALSTTNGLELVGDLRLYGMFPLDEFTMIPLIGRDAEIDPLFQFI